MRAQFPEIAQLVEQILRSVQKSPVGVGDLHQVVESRQPLLRRERQPDRLRRSTQLGLAQPGRIAINRLLKHNPQSLRFVPDYKRVGRTPRNIAEPGRDAFKRQAINRIETQPVRIRPLFP